MRALAAAALLILLMPTAGAASLFEMTLEDWAGDTVTKRGEPFPSASADILRFTSEVVDGRVVQRITVNKTPEPPADWFLLRSWFANSTNGSYHVLDIEVTPTPVESEDWVEGVIRDGDYFSPRRIDLDWRVENATWVIEFDQSVLANATCFDPGVFTRGFGGEDALYSGRRRCEQIAEPPPRMGTPSVNVNVIADRPREPVSPTVDAPGTRTPTPGVAWILVLALAVGVAIATRRR